MGPSFGKLTLGSKKDTEMNMEERKKNIRKTRTPMKSGQTEEENVYDTSNLTEQN